MQRATTNATSISSKHAQPIASPMRRPYSSSNDELSEMENFMLDPNTRTVRNHKRSRTNASKPQQQQQTTIITAPTISNNPSYQTTKNEEITIEAERYAQSRYPFPPFIVHFSTPDVTEQAVAHDIRIQMKQQHQIDIEFVGCRRSKNNCNDNEVNVLLFVKDSFSFACLYNDANWPNLINGQTFSRPSKPSIPPQLSLLIKNVNLNIHFAQFSIDLKSSYPDIINIIRMKNKKYEEIKLIKIEFNKPEQRNDILFKGKILIGSLSYVIKEYLAPARVLICSKCMAIGHFRKQCQQSNETCKTCGDSCPDLKQHSCSNNLNCIHCKGHHQSNDMKCLIVKEFRANLTKRLLAVVPNSKNNNNYYRNNNNINQFQLNQNDFPSLPDAERTIIHGYKSNNYINNNNNNMLLSKFEEMNQNLSKFMTEMIDQG
jgi:hypothetical protein